MEEETLKQFTTALADAIRDRDGTTDPINPQDFAARILALSNGEPITGEVRIFYDETKPASKFGGSWDETVFPYGTFLMAAGSGGTAGQTGGSADAVVVKHNHDVPAVLHGDPGENGYASFTWNGTLGYHITTTDVGVDGTGKNRPPYCTVHMWRKVS